MVYKSKLEYENKSDEWNELSKKDPFIYIYFGWFILTGTMLLLAMKVTLLLVPPVFIISAYFLTLFGKILIDELHTTYRFFSLPNNLPDSKLVLTIEESLKESDIEYIMKSGGKYHKTFPVDYAIKIWPLKYTEIFELPDENVCIKVRVSVTEYVPVRIAKITDETRPFITCLTELLDDYVGRKEDLYFEEKFIKQLSDPKQKVRMGSAYGLGLLESKKAVSRLVDTLEKEEDNTVKGAIIQALGKVGDKSIIPVLQRYSGDLDVALRESEENTTIGKLAQEAIGKINVIHGQNAGRESS